MVYCEFCGDIKSRQCRKGPCLTEREAAATTVDDHIEILAPMDLSNLPVNESSHCCIDMSLDEEPSSLRLSQESHSLLMSTDVVEDVDVKNGNTMVDHVAGIDGCGIGPYSADEFLVTRMQPTTATEKRDLSSYFDSDPRRNSEIAGQIQGYDLLYSDMKQLRPILNLSDEAGGD